MRPPRRLRRTAAPPRPSGAAGRGLGAAGLASLVALGAASCGPPPPPAAGPDPEGARGEAAEERGEEDRAAEERADAVGAGAAEAAPQGPLPPVPRRDGPLSVHVQYPGRHQRIAVRDSNFLFGSVGTGAAVLTIDGHPVPVEPNGAFLAFLPVPAPRGDTAVYRLVARRDGEADTLRHPVLVPSLPYLGPEGRAWLDSGSVAPATERWALPDERLELRVRGAPGLRVWLEAGGERLPLEEGPDPAAAALARWGVEAEDPPPSRLYRVEVTGGSLAGSAGIRPSRPAEAAATAGGPDTFPSVRDTLALIVAGIADADSVRLRVGLPFLLLDPAAPPVVELREAADSVNGPSGVVVGRPSPYGPYRWRFPSGTRGTVDARRGDRLRLRLAPHEAAWVATGDALLLPADTPPPSSRVGDVRVEPLADRLVLRVGLAAPLPLQVDQPDERTLVLTLYGAEGETDRIAYGEHDPLLESVDWRQAAEGVYRVVVRLRRPVWGYRAAYEPGERGAYEGPRAASPEGVDPVLRFEIRRPPRIDRRRPLRGRRIAIDPGHPGGGAHGPAGYYEGDANLAIARRLVEMLAEAGAEPLLIRSDTLPLGLYERTSRAVRGGAELFVSIHNNALPDGVRPFGREGTSTYYHHPHSRELAEAVQAGMLEEMGLRDLGILWGDLAVARMSWMPSVLAEGAFLMMPRHEAALRRPDFQARYARGVLRGLRAFLRERAAADAG